MVPNWFFILCAACQVLRTTSPTRPIACASELVILNTPISCKMYHEFRRSEEHTSELQSRFDLVCRLLLEKKKIKRTTYEGIRKDMPRSNCQTSSPTK